MSSTVNNVNHQAAERDLKYYIFDWDDNILHMPTRIHLERRRADGSWVPHKVSTSVFSVIRGDTANYRPPGGDWEAAFIEFKDIPEQTESLFLRDTRNAIETAIADPGNRAPSFQIFHRALIEGRLFAIVTARGHDGTTLRKGVEMFIDLVLSERDKNIMLSNLRGYIAGFDNPRDQRSDSEVLRYYLELNRYHAVTSPMFHRQMRQAGSAGAESPEQRKQFAVRDFVEHVISIITRIGVRRPVSVGFSDDDPSNIAAVHEFIQKELARRFPNIKFVVYDTSDPELVNGRKIVVAGQLDLPL